MIVKEETINIGYLLVEKYMVVPKHGLIVPGMSGMHQYALGKISVGPDKNKFCLFPAHVGMDVETRYQSFLFIPVREIIAFVEPEEHESFEPYKKLDIKPAGSEWINNLQKQ